MSDPRLEKVQRELEQVRMFLDGQAIPYAVIVPGPDAPDVIVRREGRLSLAIEVTGYHPEAGRVGVEKRWHQFRGVLDPLVRQHSSLKGLSIAPLFHDPYLPQIHHHEAISAEMVQCIDHLMQQGFLKNGERKLSFSEHVDKGRSDKIGPGWLILSARDWPTLAIHINVIYFQYIDWDGFMLSNSYQAQTAWCSPYGQAFRACLDGKEKKVRKAIRAGKYAKDGGNLWLLITCNSRDDLSSHVFGSDQLKSALDESGFDFGGSQFDQIWLMDESSKGRAQRLYPWSDFIG